MKHLIAFLSVFASLLSFSSAYAQPNTVHLKGKLVDMPNPVIMKYNGAASLLGDSRDVMLYTNAEGVFDTIIPLANPEYYSISRNTLYLTPGDKLEVYITDRNTEAQFNGKGAEVNEYMKFRLFPKGGSFLETGKNIKKDFSATKKTIDSLAGIRLKQLADLKDASAEFKDLEKARVTADVINSYTSYPPYASDNGEYKGLSKEESKVKSEKIFSGLAPEINTLIKKIAAEKYLNVAVVRDVMSGYSDPADAPFFKGIEISAKTKELYEALTYVSTLRGQVSNEIIAKTQAYAKGIKNADFKAEVDAKLKQLNKLVKGNSAIDIVLEDVVGNKRNLSDFKGKVLYIDLWATWCGPCIQEAPKFQALSKKYAGKDIVFLQISTDSQTKPWLKFLEKKESELTQYISFDSKLKTDWAIFYIPRFLLIDKNFNIIDAYATLPSSENIEEILNNALK